MDFEMFPMQVIALARPVKPAQLPLSAQTIVYASATII